MQIQKQRFQMKHNMWGGSSCSFKPALVAEWWQAPSLTPFIASLGCFHLERGKVSYNMKDRPRKRKLRYCLECGDPEKTTSTCQVLQVSPPVQSTPQKDSDGSVIEYTSDGEMVHEIADIISRTTTGTFGCASSMDVDAEGNIYILDAGRNEILVLETD